MNTIKFPNLQEEEYVIGIQRTEKFYTKAKELSKFILSLPLKNIDNDKLVALILENVQIAESSAYKQGFSNGVRIMLEELEN